jgi:hypothetical protein
MHLMTYRTTWCEDRPRRQLPQLRLLYKRRSEYDQLAEVADKRATAFS